MEAIFAELQHHLEMAQIYSKLTADHLNSAREVINELKKEATKDKSENS